MATQNDILSQDFASDAGENELALQKNIFLMQWSELFPGASSPDTEFEDTKAVEQQLMACRKLINNLQGRLKQEQFYLLFLQVCLIVCCCFVC